MASNLISRLKQQPAKPAPFVPSLPRERTGFRQLDDRLKAKELIPIVIRIFQFMEPSTRARAAGTCKMWQVVAEHIAEADDDDEEGVEDDEDEEEEEEEEEAAPRRAVAAAASAVKAKAAAAKPAAAATPSRRPDSKGSPPPSSPPAARPAGPRPSKPRIASPHSDVPPPPPPPGSGGDDIPPPPPPPEDHPGSRSVSPGRSGHKAGGSSGGSGSLKNLRIGPSPRREGAPVEPSSPRLRLGDQKDKDGGFGGYLLKRSNANRHIWQKRFFQYFPGDGKTVKPHIAYYKSDKDVGQPVRQQGALYLDQVRDLELASKGKGSETRCRFSLRLATKEMHLIAENPSDAQKWIQTLSQAKSQVQQHQSKAGEPVQGMLKMKAGKLWNAWFWVLDEKKKEPQITYYRNEKEKNSGRLAAKLGTIIIKHIRSVELLAGAKDAGEGVRFDLVIDFDDDPRPGKPLTTVSLLAESMQDCRRWLEVFQKYGIEVR